MNWWLVGILTWPVWGILGYGLAKGGYRSHFEKEKRVWGFGEREERICRFWGLGGPVCLILGILLILFFYKGRLRLCFKMPEKLCEP